VYRCTEAGLWSRIQGSSVYKLLCEEENIWWTVSKNSFVILSTTEGKQTRAYWNSKYCIFTLNKKENRNSRHHLRFQRDYLPRWNRFWRLLKRLSRRICSHMRNGFSLLIRGILYIGLICEKNVSQKSRGTASLIYSDEKCMEPQVTPSFAFSYQRRLDKQCY
jgi:hypothetical protein